MTMSIEQLTEAYEMMRVSCGRALAIAADASERVNALSWELYRIREGAKHLAGDPTAALEMPPGPTLRPVFRHEPAPRVEFEPADTEPAPPLDWMADRFPTERAPKGEEEP